MPPRAGASPRLQLLKIQAEMLERKEMQKRKVVQLLKIQAEMLEEKLKHQEMLERKEKLEQKFSLDLTVLSLGAPKKNR